MLPMRLANLPQGSTLVLGTAAKSGSASAADQVANVKLQVSDEGRTPPLIMKVGVHTTVRGMLEQFETEFAVELAKRTETVGRSTPKSEQQVQISYRPVLQIFTTTIASDADFDKKLVDLGISGGSVVVRLTFQKDAEHLVADAGLVPAVPAVPQQQQQQQQQQPTLMTTEANQLNDLVEQDILAQKEEQFAAAGGRALARDDSVQVQDGDAEDRQEVDPTPKLFNPATDHYVVPSDDDRSYEMTVDQAKLYQQSIVNSGLNARTRQKLNAHKKQPVVKCVSVRIRFPNRAILELTFSPSDTANKLYDTLRHEYLSSPDIQFDLYQSYPHRLIIPSDVLMLNLLGPKSVLVLQTAEKTEILKAGIRAESLRFDAGDGADGVADAAAPAPPATPAPQQAPDAPAKDKKVPKWFKIGKK